MKTLAFSLRQDMSRENALKECQDVGCRPAAYVSTIFLLVRTYTQKDHGSANASITDSKKQTHILP